MGTTRLLVGVGGSFALLVIGSMILAQDAGSDTVVTGDAGSEAAMSPELSSPVALDAATLQTVKTMPWKQATEVTDPLRDQAKNALATGNSAWAAAKFQEVAQLLPASPRAANDWLMAAGAYGKAGQVMQAKAACDQAVSICSGLLAVDHSRLPDPQQQQPNPDTAKDTLRRALQHKAEICRDSGDAAGAMAAIQRFRAEESEYQHLRAILPLQAELQGVAFDHLNAQEAAAWKLSDEAKWAWNQGNAEKSLHLAEQTISQYPETGGAMLACKTKARVLWRLKRRDDLRATCQAIADRVGQVAPSSELARFAASEIAFHDGIGLYRQMERRPRSMRPTAEEWRRVRQFCREVIAKHHNEGARATMYEVLITSYYRENAHEEVVKEEKQFMALYGITRNYRYAEFRRTFANVEVNTAQSLATLKRYPEARQRCETLLFLAQQEPKLPPKESDLILQYALTMKCVLLLQDDAVPDKAQATQLVSEIEAKWPGSAAARRVRVLADALQSQPVR